MRIFFAVCIADIIPLSCLSVLDYLLNYVLPWHIGNSLRRFNERRGVKWNIEKGLPHLIIGTFILLCFMIVFLIPLLMMLFEFNLMSAYLTPPGLSSSREVLNAYLIQFVPPLIIDLLIRVVGRIVIFRLCWRRIVSFEKRKAEKRGDGNLDSMEERLNKRYHRFLSGLAKVNTGMLIFTLTIYIYQPGWLRLFAF